MVILNDLDWSVWAWSYSFSTCGLAGWAATIFIEYLSPELNDDAFKACCQYVTMVCSIVSHHFGSSMASGTGFHKWKRTSGMVCTSEASLEGRDCFLFGIKWGLSLTYCLLQHVSGDDVRFCSSKLAASAAAVGINQGMPFACVVCILQEITS